MTEAHLPLIGTLTLRTTLLRRTMMLEVRSDEHSNLLLTLFQHGERKPLTDIIRTGQALPPLRVDGDNEQIMRTLAAWVNDSSAKATAMSIYPTVIHRLGPTPGAAEALREMSEGMAERLLAIPEPFLGVSHIEVRAELYRRRAQAARDTAAGLEVRRLRAEQWGIPARNPIKEHAE